MFEDGSGRHEHACTLSGKREAEFAASERVDEQVLHLVLHGPVYFALGLCAGAVTYFSLGFEPAFAVVLAISVLGVGGGIYLLRHNGGLWRRMVTILLIGAAAGGLIAKIHTSLRPAPEILRTLGPTMIEGWVTDVEPGQNGVRLRLKVHAIGALAVEDLPREIRLTHSLSLNVSPGRFVRCWAVLRPPPQPGLPGDYSFNRQAFFEGLSGVGYVQGRCRGGALGKPEGLASGLKFTIAQARRQLAEHVREKAGERAGGFAAALTSGDRSFMSVDNTEALRNSGLAHLLAISGLHLGIVGGLVYFAVRRSLALWEWLALRVAVQKPAAATALFSTGVYMVLSGASISTQRAFIMAAVFFGAILLDRSPLSFRSFAVAMIVVICMQPYSVVTPGFQMSFAATGALIATYMAWRRRRVANGQVGGTSGAVFMIKSLVVTSAVGAAATAPFALYHFDRVAPAGFFANLAAMPIVTFISAPCAGLALLASPFGLDGPFLRLFGWSLERVLDVANWTAGNDANGIHFGEPMPAAVLLVASIGLAGLCLATGLQARIKVVAVSLTLGLSAWWMAPQIILHWSASGDLFVRQAGGGLEKYTFVDGDGLSPLRFSDMPVAGSCEEGSCTFATPTGRVRTAVQSNARLCRQDADYVLASTGTFSACDTGVQIINWRKVLAGNGITLLKPRFGPARFTQQSCGHRKWMPCLAQRLDDPQS